MAETRTVTLRLKAKETCAFDREEVKYVDSATQHVVESSLFGSITSKTVTKVTEYFWKFQIDYEFFFFQGADPVEKITLCERTGRCEIRTGSKNSPRPEVVIRDPIDLNFSWILRQLDPETLATIFEIDRSAKSCHTPRRNQQIEAAGVFLTELNYWAQQVHDYFRHQVFPVDRTHTFNLSSIDAKYFVPVLPLFRESGGEIVELKQIEAQSPTGALVVYDSPNSQPSPVALSLGDVNSFLSEQLRSIAEKKEEFQKIFTGGDGVVTACEARNLSVILHMKDIFAMFALSVNHIETLMRKQLIAAIGKEITPTDFAKYMVFHNRKLMRKDFEPSPFCYAVRRPDHFPEGVVSIEVQLPGESAPEPVNTQVRRYQPEYPMQFAINAATKVSFFGDRYVHAWISHQFSGQGAIQASFNARARQFSSFIILIGNIASNSLFLPKFGIIVQNKDDLKIPLLLEQIPTAQEFKDAIESLSPEQQRFAKAYRSMQLESTLFGVCILQIKPQLEKLLNLPFDSLTKEIRLTQELMELFIKYQIPSDLLSYSGEDCPPHVKVEFVKNQVKAMYDMINSAKQKEIEEKTKEAEYAAMQREIKVTEEPEHLRRMVLSDRVVLKEKSVRKSRKAETPMRKARSAAPPAASASVPASQPAAAPSAAPVSPAPAPAPEVKNSAVEEPKIPSLGGNFEEEIKDTQLTNIPTELDSKLGFLEDSIRPIIITADKNWTRRAQKALLSPPIQESLNSSKIDEEKDRAFDLLDALSRSGGLPFDEASLHVFIGMSHCFDQTVLDTLIKKNVNPIERVEQTCLLVASTIHEKPVKELIKDDQVSRIESVLPQLLQ
eukprot:TRINITY_DN8150_c0_g1_i1.p1 TRINITY_DN8150_c0_g1~~TRINITY_DN8150_c0_g1_i1.p1  ORF type:complete len:920 (-),score=216.91 TRINITY_DN8150_c0_g1_i1:129-2636(-)